MTIEQERDIADQVKMAEKRGYQRGYQAGHRRLKSDISRDRVYAERRAFLERAFLAALTASIESNGWAVGTTPITSMKDRTSLAWDFAEEALKQRRYPK